MITEQDLKQAIAACQGEREPDSNTCIKLAAFLILQDHLYPQEKALNEQQFISDASLIPDNSYSFDTPPNAQPEKYIEYDGDSEFALQIFNRKSGKIWAIMDELMSTLKVVYPRLYAGVMRQINST